MAQPEPQLEPNQTSLESHENGCSPTVPIQPDGLVLLADADVAAHVPGAGVVVVGRRRRRRERLGVPGKRRMPGAVLHPTRGRSPAVGDPTLRSSA